ncbi:replicative DNA helicase [Dehalogenimonas formicexedens]|uniref:Replicative DNA helicase n=1 Tax=Dehalogenimonas formicexedens TaxID=1839801 RepID=A0A1P8F6D7_9CHLR|nr:replicative DNA helicase [Dehalogenimonas formicexedens]APV44046.1 replicative DNA helicase [Dehalogenimonas formicexedens]
MVETRLPPFDPAAEEAVNGSLLIDDKVIYDLAPFLKPQDFYTEPGRLVYEAALTLFQRGEPIDQITVAQELERQQRLERIGGAAYIAHLLSVVPTSLDAVYYANIVSNLSISRQLIVAGTQIANLGYTPDPDPTAAIAKAETFLFKVRSERSSQDFIHIKNILDKYLEPVQLKEQLESVPTGFYGLNDYIGGMKRGDLIIVAGRPSMGKTSLGLNIARNSAVDHHACVAMFSLEMSSESLVQRLLSSEAGINTRYFQPGLATPEDENRIMHAIGNLSEAPIFIDDSPQLRVSELRAKAQRLNFEHKLDLLIVDYLQLLQGESASGRDNRVQEISYISRSLKGIARELNVPVVALSQLSRAVEWRSTHVPQLSDLRESGSIEQDADIVIFIYRDEVYFKEEEWAAQFPDKEYPREIADIIIAKHRNGPTGTVKVRFRHALTKFENLESITEIA